MKVRIIMNNVHVQVTKFDDNEVVVFTTTDRKVAAILMLICNDANITDTSNEYHYQGWLKTDMCE